MSDDARARPSTNAIDTSRPQWLRSGGLEILLSLLLLAGTLWVARYWWSAGFGLYEDDLSNIPYGVQLSASAWWSYTLSSLAHFGWSGKPIHLPLIYLLSKVGFQLAGLRGDYLLGFGILTANAWLTYGLLRRLGGQALALVGGLAYSLFSADTTQAFLTHSFGLQPSMTFLLLALHAFLADRRALSYALAFGTLLTYETVFPVFLAAPILLPSWGRGMRRHLVWHAVIMGLILAAVAVVRLLVGDRRVSGLTFPGILTTPLVHMAEGPFVSLGTYFYRLVQAIRGAEVLSVAVMLVAFAAFAWAIDQSRGVRLGEARGAWAQARTAASGATGRLVRLGRMLSALPEPAKRWLRLLAAGLAMVVLAYPLTFTVRAYAISGRDTRVHFAAVAGASLVVGCIASGLLGWADSAGRKRIAAMGLAAFFALLVGFGFVIQKDYVDAWQLQRDFWSEILPLIPDVGDSTVVLVDPAGLRDTRQIAANYWNMPRVLESIYRFPSGWELPPRVYRLAPGWQRNILTSGGLLILNAATTVAPPSNYRTVEPGNTIMLVWSGSEWTRQTAPLEVSDSQVDLRALPTSVLQEYPEGFLYPLLIESSVAHG